MPREGSVFVNAAIAIRAQNEDSTMIIEIHQGGVKQELVKRRCTLAPKSEREKCGGCVVNEPSFEPLLALLGAIPAILEMMMSSRSPNRSVKDVTSKQGGVSVGRGCCVIQAVKVYPSHASPAISPSPSC